MPVFLQEYDAGAYDVGSYFLGRTLVRPVTSIFMMIKRFVPLQCPWAT